MKIKTLLAFAIIANTCNLSAQVKELSRIGQTPGGASSYVGYDSAGQRLFSGCGTSIWVYDVSDTNNYHVIAKRPLMGLVNETDLYGDILFVAATHDGLWALDVNSDTLTPLAHYKVYGDSAAYDMWRTNDTIYMADMKSVKVLKYDTVNGFTKIDQFGNVNANAVARRGNYIAVGCRGFAKGTVDIYHVNDLETPVASWKNNKIWNLQDLQFADLNDNIIYICGGTQNLLFTKSYFFAIKFTGDSLYALDSFSVNGVIGLAQANIINMDSRNDTLFLATTAGLNNKLETIVPILDASGLPEDTLKEIGYVRPGLWHFDVALMNGTPYLAMSSEWYGVLISDVSELEPLDTLGFLETGGWTDRSFIRNDTLWVCHRGFGLSAYILDSLYYNAGYLNDGEILHIFTQFVSDFDFLNDTLIILNTAEIFNLSPWLAGGHPEKAGELDIGFIGSMNYMETNTGPRVIAGFSHIIPMPTALLLCDPYDTLNTEPIMDSIQIKSNVFGVDVSGDTVYTGRTISNQQYLALYKIIDDEFVLIDTIASPGEISSISVEKNKIAVTCGFSGMAWYTLNNTTLVLEGTLFDWGFSPVGVFLKNDYAYIADKFFGLKVYDISTTEAELRAECTGTGGWYNMFGCTSVDVGSDGIIYLSDFQAGVIIIEPFDINTYREEQLLHSTGKTYLTIYPNPAYTDINIKLVSVTNDRLKDVVIYNNGKRILELENINSEVARILLGDRPAGLYLISATTTQNKILNRKLIVY